MKAYKVIKEQKCSKKDSLNLCPEINVAVSTDQLKIVLQSVTDISF